MVGCDSMSGSSQDLDASAWGDHRTALLKVTTQRGMLVQQESGFIARQPCRNDWQLGPFSTVDSKTAEHLFDTVVRNHAFRRGLVVDAPDSNRAARRLFHRRNMRITGSTVLMYAGKKPAYRPELLYGLATMGSCG
jgi:hypothetical protein